jgi:HAMP domain-containing protein
MSAEVLKKVSQLTALARDDRGNVNERLAAALGALKIIDEYKLLSGGNTGKSASIATEILNKVISGDFMDEVADRVEKTASAFERMMAAGKRMTDARGPVKKKRKRTYR